MGGKRYLSFPNLFLKNIEFSENPVALMRSLISLSVIWSFHYFYVHFVTCSALGLHQFLAEFDQFGFEICKRLLLVLLVVNVFFLGSVFDLFDVFVRQKKDILRGHFAGQFCL